jgi:hypothetical protein
LRIGILLVCCTHVKTEEKTMNRKTIGMTAYFVLMASTALAQTTKQDVIDEMTAQGFQRIEISNTLFGNLRFRASGPGIEREVVLGKDGTVVRDRFERDDEDDEDDDEEDDDEIDDEDDDEEDDESDERDEEDDDDEGDDDESDDGESDSDEGDDGESDSDRGGSDEGDDGESDGEGDDSEGDDD